MDLKHVEDFEITHRFGRSRISLRLKDCELSKDVRDQIITATDKILAGRQLILSATDIEMHGTTTKSSVVEKRALELSESKLSGYVNKIGELQAENAELRDELSSYFYAIEVEKTARISIRHSVEGLRTLKDKYGL